MEVTLYMTKNTASCLQYDACCLPFAICCLLSVACCVISAPSVIQPASCSLMPATSCQQRWAHIPKFWFCILTFTERGNWEHKNLEMQIFAFLGYFSSQYIKPIPYSIISMSMTISVSMFLSVFLFVYVSAHPACCQMPAV